MAKRKLQFYIDSETYELLKRLKDEHRYSYAEVIRLALGMIITGQETSQTQAIREAAQSLNA